MAAFLPLTARSALVSTLESSTGTAFASTPWAGNVSATDLINNGQATLASASATVPNFGPGAINDGSGATTQTDSSFYSSGGALGNDFPAVATYDLDLTVNTLGYDLTEIQSFMGWQANSAAHGNQIYTVAVRDVGSATYTDLPL